MPAASSHLQLGWQKVTNWSMPRGRGMEGRGLSQIGTTAQKTQPFPWSLHLVFLQWSAVRPGHWSVSLVPTLHPLLHRQPPPPPWGHCSPSILWSPPRWNVSHPPLIPTPCSKFKAHCSCREIFASYLPNICSLRKSLPNVLPQQEKTHFHSVFPFGFVYVCFFKGSMERMYLSWDLCGSVFSFFFFFCTVSGFFHPRSKAPTYI